MRTAVVLALIMLAGAGHAQQASFRQYLEAEDCLLDNLREGRNPLSSYIGDRFVYNIIAEPWTGRLSAPLAATVPPGPVQVMVRVFASDGEPETRIMTVRLGGAEAALRYPAERLNDKMNWLPFALDCPQAADRVEVEVACTGGRVIVDSILVTNDPEDGTYFDRGRTRLIERYVPPAEVTARPETPGNLLVNSGFEVAPTNGWRAGYQSQWALTEELLSADRPCEGARCLRVPMMRDRRGFLQERWYTYDGIYAAPVRTEPGASYAASVYVRTDGPLHCGLGLKGAPAWFDIEGSPDWQRLTAISVAPADTDEFYVTFSADGPREVAIDAAQLERAEVATDYAPRPGADVGLSGGGRPGRIWREGEDVPLTFELAGHGAQTPVMVRYLIHDALGRVVQRDGFEATAPAEGVSTVRLHDGPHPTGAFRVAYEVEAAGAAPCGGQLTYSVIPAARGEGEGPVGLYASHSRPCFAAMAAAGIHWTNTLSSAGHFAEWSYVEPEDDVFVFHDEDLELAREFGIRILANINTNRSNMPGWLLREEPGAGEWIRHPMGWFALDEWEEFVTALVEHYRGDVEHWLILDEPDVGTNRYSPEDYLKLQETAYRAAHRADPDCTVFVHTGTDSAWRTQLFAALTPAIYDAQYTYIGRFERAVGEARGQEGRAGKPLWTVDFAPVRPLATHYAAVSAGEVAPWDECAENTRQYDTWAVRSLSWGRSERWFRYDARYPGPPPGTSYMSIWEHDGSLTPHGVSIATMNALIADAQPQGQIEMPDGIEGHPWVAGNRRLVIAWTTDGSVRRLAGPGARARDAYGGALDEPVVGSLPSFIELTGDLPAWEAPAAESVAAELLPPEAEGGPYRARFVATVAGPARGTWSAAGPYFLEREQLQRFPAEAGPDGRVELTVPLNVYANLPVHDREARVRLQLPGRVLEGVLAINTAAAQNP